MLTLEKTLLLAVVDVTIVAPCTVAAHFEYVLYWGIVLGLAAALASLWSGRHRSSLRKGTGRSRLVQGEAACPGGTRTARPLL